MIPLSEQNTPAQNQQVIVDAMKATSAAGGGVIVIPNGTFKTKGIDASCFNDHSETLYCSFVGLGQKVSIIQHEGSEESLFDGTGLDFFDVSMRGIGWYGANKNCFKLSQGGRHYRVLFENVEFRGAENGLYLNNGQHFTLNHVTCQKNSKYGLVLAGPRSVAATNLDLEQCGIAGMVIRTDDDNTPGREHVPVIVNGIHCEQNAKDIIIDGVHGAYLHGVAGESYEFKNGARDNFIQGNNSRIGNIKPVEFNGAWQNRVDAIYSPIGDYETNRFDFPLSEITNGVSLGLNEWTPHNTPAIYTNGQRYLFGFNAAAVSGQCSLKISIQNKVNGVNKWWDFPAGSWSDSSKEVSPLRISDDARKYQIPIVMNEAEYVNIRVYLQNGIQATVGDFEIV